MHVFSDINRLTNDNDQNKKLAQAKYDQIKKLTLQNEELKKKLG